MVYKFKSVLTGQEAFRQWIKEFPEKVQTRVFRHAGRKAATAVSTRAKALTPRSKPPRNKKAKPWHIADKHTFVQRVYRASKSTVFVIGYESSTAPHGHLVEDGNPLTRPRLINHKTQYVNVRQGIMRRRKLVTTKSGAVRTVWEQVSKSKKKSIGSFRLEGVGVSSNLKSRISGENRGNMPAFHPLGRATKEMQGIVGQIIESEVRAGLQRVVDRGKK